MAKAIKKVDVKKVSKLEVSAKVKALFEGLGISVNEGVDFGFTEGTLVLSLDKCDIQVKLIAPKAGLERYIKLDEEEDEAEEETVICNHLKDCKSKDEEICKECARNKKCESAEPEDFLEI